MEFLLLDLVKYNNNNKIKMYWEEFHAKIIGLLETHGDLTGEKKDL